MGATSQPCPLLAEQGAVLGAVGGYEAPDGGGADAAVAALTVRIDGCRTAAFQALAAPVAVADLIGQGRVPAAPMIGLAGCDPLAGLAVGGEPAAADVEVAGWLGQLTSRAALGCSRQRGRDMVLGRAPGGGGLVSGFVSGTYSVLLGRGGTRWHERRAFVLVKWPLVG